MPDTAIIAAVGAVVGIVLTKVGEFFASSLKDRQHERETVNASAQQTTVDVKLVNLEDRVNRLESDLSRRIEKLDDDITRKIDILSDDIGRMLVELGVGKEKDRALSRDHIPDMRQRIDSNLRRILFIEAEVGEIRGHVGLPRSLTPPHGVPQVILENTE